MTKRPTNMPRPAKRVMDPIVFDYLELAAEEFGGIGGGHFNDFDYGEIMVPYCVYGYAGPGYLLVWEELDRLGITELGNDAAVRAINAGGLRENVSKRYNRVPFKKWCKALNIVRGADA